LDIAAHKFVHNLDNAVRQSDGGVYVP
jgi:hypothetical protein